jgi:hypothetical protein
LLPFAQPSDPAPGLLLLLPLLNGSKERACSISLARFFPAEAAEAAADATAPAAPASML